MAGDGEQQQSAQVPAAPDVQSPSRRDLGAFYTPAWAVARMLSMVPQLGAATSVLEPSGGDGAFVSALLAAGVRPQSVTVWDINAQVREPLEAMGVHVEIGDALLREPGQSFDLILGNPPYLNKQSAYVRANRRALSRRYAHVGVNDAYALFTAMSLERLNPSGRLLFLISDTFLTLGIHARLRAMIVSGFRLDSVTLLPRDTFSDANVSTAILDVVAEAAPPGHLVRFTDARAASAPDLSGPVFEVPQAELAANPSCLLAFSPEDRRALRLVASLPPLMDFLDGGLGLHTGDNARYLRPLTPGRPHPLEAGWRSYHKRGGAQQWFAPLDHVIYWPDPLPDSYGVPATALAGAGTDGRPRRGFALSGVSSRLAARSLVPGALWESNKVFGLFPKDPQAFPVEFFLAALNSPTYAGIARALNHTVSFQVRDLHALPMLPFTPGEVALLADWGAQALAHVRDGGPGIPPTQPLIDALVAEVADRAAGGPPISA